MTCPGDHHLPVHKGKGEEEEGEGREVRWKRREGETGGMGWRAGRETRRKEVG